MARDAKTNVAEVIELHIHMESGDSELSRVTASFWIFAHNTGRCITNCRSAHIAYL